jgi:hypothetical protein
MFKKFILSAGLCMVFFVFFEGLASTGFALYKILAPSGPGRSLSGPHLQFDSELGWASVPHFCDKDYYAPGVYLKTNSQGFRSSGEFTAGIPAGKLRIICSGDSQTFGDGVANDQDWCQDLETYDPRIQAVNMAEIGYGADQMYLRYKRAGAAMDHDVHLFAIVTDDLLRMRYATMGGYGKPVLKLRNGELTTEKAAVGQRSAVLHWLALKPHPLRQFRSVEVVADIVDSAKAGRPVASSPPSTEERQRLGALIESLEAMETNKGSILVFVYIPTRTIDYTPGGPSEPWREAVREECAKRGAAVIDLIDDYRKLPITTRDGLFIWPGTVQNFVESIGHFSVSGHDYIARQVFTKLVAIPEVAGKIAALPPLTDTRPVTRPVGAANHMSSR